MGLIISSYFCSGMFAMPTAHCETFQKLLHQLDLTRSPSLIDPGLEGGVHAKDNEPALAGNRLDPVILVPLGRLEPEVDRVGSIAVLLEALGVDGLPALNLVLGNGDNLVALDADIGDIVVHRLRVHYPAIVDDQIIVLRHGGH